MPNGANITMKITNINIYSIKFNQTQILKEKDESKQQNYKTSTDQMLCIGYSRNVIRMPIIHIFYLMYT